MLNDQVSVIAKCPEIAVGGRLSHFLPKWKEITTDFWVLDVIENGYKLEFVKKPPFLGIKETRVPSHQKDLIGKEIEALLEKNAIEIVPEHQIQSGFYSTLFLVPKKNGEMRPVINLRPLNSYLEKKHFKMDTITKVINLVKKGDWSISLDLKDAYFHIKVFKKHRKYLRFSFQNVVYQFRALCFGPTSAPRVFTKIVAVVVAYLRQQNIRLASYLDDWFALNQKIQEILLDRSKMISLLFHLGFIINKKKSDFVPNQNPIYIGGQFNLRLGLVCPSSERILKMKDKVHQMLQGQNTAKDFLILLGMMASCLELIPNARLFMRPVQLHLLHYWSPARMSMRHMIPVTPELVSNLAWWLLDQNILRGRDVQQSVYQITVTTDASNFGWGGHMKNQTVQGQWSKMEKMEHINCLEMKAVFFTLKQFLLQLRGQNVLIRSDNTTVVQYLNKQGGTKSVRLCQLTWDLWQLALQNNIGLRAAHILGKRNVLADILSRQKIVQTEWALNRVVVHQLFNLWGTPLLDLFATWENKRTHLFCSWINHPQAFAVDALSIAWSKMFAYAFPPTQLISRMLEHLQNQSHCTLILIAPCWPRQFWFPLLLELLIAQPVYLPCSQNLLSQARGKIFHPDPETLNLTAWLVSTESGQQRAFQNKLENCSLPLGGKEHKKITNASLDNSVIGVVNKKLIRIQHL